MCDYVGCVLFLVCVGYLTFVSDFSSFVCACGVWLIVMCVCVCGCVALIWQDCLSAGVTQVSYRQFETEGVDAVAGH